MAVKNNISIICKPTALGSIQISVTKASRFVWKHCSGCYCWLCLDGAATSQLSLNYDDEHPPKAREHVTSDKSLYEHTSEAQFILNANHRRIQEEKKNTHKTRLPTVYYKRAVVRSVVPWKYMWKSVEMVFDGVRGEVVGVIQKYRKQITWAERGRFIFTE